MTNYEHGVVIPPYRYRSDGPWRLAAEHRDGEIIEFTIFETLFEAIAAFDRFHLPPCPNRSVGVYDDNYQLVVYYQSSPDRTEVAWGGTAEGYDLLELIHDEPVSVVIWAAAARGEFTDLVGL